MLRLALSTDSTECESGHFLGAFLASIDIGRVVGAVSSVCVAADEVELTESRLSNSGSSDGGDADDDVEGISWVRTALDAGGADVFLTVTSCGICPKVKGFWVCRRVGVGRGRWSTMSLTPPSDEDDEDDLDLDLGALDALGLGLGMS